MEAPTVLLLLTNRGSSEGWFIGISFVDGVGVSSLWVGVGDSSMSSRPVSLTFSSLEVDTDRLRFGKELGSSLKSSILWPLLKKKCFYVKLLQIYHFFFVCFYLPGSNINRIQIGSWGTRGFGKNCCGIRTATNTIVIHMNTYGWYR